MQQYAGCSAGLKYQGHLVPTKADAVLVEVAQSFAGETGAAVEVGGVGQ